MSKATTMRGLAVLHVPQHQHHWRTNGSRWELVTAGRVVAKVVPDAVYAGCGDRSRRWCALGHGQRQPGEGSGRDGADAIIRQRHLGASPMRRNDPALTKEPGTSALALEASVTAEIGAQYELALT